jgi:outer membrane protein TolC
VSAEVGYNQTATAFSDAYRSLLGQQQFAVEVQLPLVQWGMGKARIEAARASQREVENTAYLEEQRQAQEAYFVAHNLDQLRQQVDLAAKADTVATRRFEVAKQRYLVGLGDSNNLFTGQNDKDAARQAYTEALGAYWGAYYQLRRLTLYDFAANGAIAAPSRDR